MYTMILLPHSHFSPLPILLFSIALLFSSIFHLSLALNLFVQSIAHLSLRFLILSTVLPFSFCTFFVFSLPRFPTVLNSLLSSLPFSLLDFPFTLVVLFFFDIHYADLLLHLTRSTPSHLLLPILSRPPLALDPFLV